MSFSNSAYVSGAPDSVLPVLSAVLPESEISQALRAALDALDQEKLAFMNLSGEMLDALRPEMERMACDLVRNSLNQAWRLRHPTGLRVVGTDIP
jgi:hypothetical protein